MATSASEQEKKYRQQQAEQTKKINQTYDSYAEAMEDSIRQQKEIAAQQRDQSLTEQKQAYRDMHDQAAAQEYINRQKTREAMSNAGLSDSGLNRTQQTAISISRGNQDAQLTRQQQAAREATMLAYNELVAKFEAEREAQRLANEQKRQAELLDLESVTGDNIAKAYAAEAEAAAENQKLLQDAYLAILKQTDGDETQADKIMQKLYGVSFGGGQAQTGTGETGEQIRTQDNTPLANRTWYRTKITGNSGLNTALGLIDDNDMVTDEFGNSMTMRDLYNALIEEGQMDNKTAKDYILSLQKQNAGRYLNGNGYTAKMPKAQSYNTASQISEANLKQSLKMLVSSGKMKQEDAAADILNYFYPYDTDAQKRMLSEIGYSDKTIDALIKANAG